MHALMWRLSDTHAVLYTDDRGTLRAALAYPKLPHRDAAGATTYCRKSGRAFAWQITFPASLWNGVVRHLGRSSLVFLDDVKPPRASPQKLAPVTPLSPAARDSASMHAASRRAAAKESPPAPPAVPARAPRGKPVVPAVATAAPAPARGKGRSSPPTAAAVTRPAAPLPKAASPPTPSGKRRAPSARSLRAKEAIRSQQVLLFPEDGRDDHPRKRGTVARVGAAARPEAAPRPAGPSKAERGKTLRDKSG